MIQYIDDTELVSAFRAGNISAYEELVSRYYEKAYNLAVRITRSKEDAEEILQDVFISIFSKINEFQGKSAFSSWLYRITVNTAYMKLRKRRKHSAVELNEVICGNQECWTHQRSDVCDTNYLTSRHELKQALQTAVNKLPSEYKVIFILRDVDGLSNQEVSEVLNISVPAVKSRLHRSRLMLRKRLQGFHDDYINRDNISYGPRMSSERVYNKAA
jgi:RNA polymerase sigma-70 factor, ECF subfamily